MKGKGCVQMALLGGPLNALLDFWGWLFIFVVLIDVATALHILLNKREEPTSAILWLLVVFDFHLLGVATYLVLGVNRLKTMGEKVRGARESIRRAGRTAYSDFLDRNRRFLGRDDKDGQTPPEYSKILDRLMPESRPFSGNKIELLEDGTMAYPRMLDAIRRAKSHIHLQSYIIMDDEEGRKVFAALRQQAERGVEVRVLYDQVGSAKALWSRFFPSWEAGLPNFQIQVFSKLSLLAPWRIQLRNHRKLMVVDGRKAFAGGVNISSDSDAKFRNRNIHDLHAEIVGPVVAQLQQCFLTDWCFATKEPPQALLHRPEFFPDPVETIGGSLVRLNASGPGQNYEGTEKMFLTAATAAHRFLWIITPYFVPDKPFLRALCMAAAKGVDVRVIIPRNNNHWYVRNASSSLYASLLANGVRIFERTGSFSHSKALLVDGTWGAMGSSNCDNRSFRLNYELDFVVEKGRFVKELYLQFRYEMAKSEELMLPLRKSLRQDLLESFCSLMTPIL